MCVDRRLEIELPCVHYGALMGCPTRGIHNDDRLIDSPWWRIRKEMSSFPFPWLILCS